MKQLAEISEAKRKLLIRLQFTVVVDGDMYYWQYDGGYNLTKSSLYSAAWIAWAQAWNYYCAHMLFERQKSNNHMVAGLVDELVEALACVTCRLDWHDGPMSTEKPYIKAGREALAHAEMSGYEIPEPFKSALGVLDT